MKILWVFLGAILLIQGCLQPLEDPQVQKVDPEMQCGFGSSDC
ncbi:hypothetical protein [Helicobacter sp. 11S02596-1]|nr:hypothetical protein [Helicobacter sp. 11S02596-1]